MQTAVNTQRLKFCFLLKCQLIEIIKQIRAIYSLLAYSQFNWDQKLDEQCHT